LHRALDAIGEAYINAGNLPVNGTECSPASDTFARERHLGRPASFTRGALTQNFGDVLNGKTGAREALDATQKLCQDRLEQLRK
jgi:hypothetical protein